MYLGAANIYNIIFNSNLLDGFHAADGTGYIPFVL